MPEVPGVRNGMHDGKSAQTHDHASSHTPGDDPEVRRVGTGPHGQWFNGSSRFRKFFWRKSGKSEAFSKSDAVKRENARAATFEQGRRDFEESNEEEADCFVGFFIFHPFSTARLGWDIWVVILLICTPPPCSLDQLSGEGGRAGCLCSNRLQQQPTGARCNRS